MNSKRTLSVFGLSAVAALGLSGCVATADQVAGGDDAGGDSKGEVTIAEFSGWEEGIATSELWKVVLEEQGYEVTIEPVDAAAVFQGLADGDYDFTTDVWEPVTHASYLEKYGDQIPVVGVDNVPGSTALEDHDLPRECVLAFGQEGPGLTPDLVDVCDVVLHITQFGSTRSINAGAAAAIAMHEWVRRHVLGQEVR